MGECTNVPQNTPAKNCSRIIPKVVRSIFVLIALSFFCRAFHQTMIKAKQGNILIKEEVRVFPRYTYPSITFCYKYKHGSKDALRNYDPYLYERWKISGNSSFLKASRISKMLRSLFDSANITMFWNCITGCLMDNLDKPGDVVRLHENVANYSDCLQKCKDTEECSIWTYCEAFCWLKDENTFRAISPDIVGGIKDCEGTGVHIYPCIHISI